MGGKKSKSEHTPIQSKQQNRCQLPLPNEFTLEVEVDVEEQVVVEETVHDEPSQRQPLRPRWRPSPPPLRQRGSHESDVEMLSTTRQIPAYSSQTFQNKHQERLRLPLPPEITLEKDEEEVEDPLYEEPDKNIADLQQEHQREMEGLLENVRQLSRELELQMTVIDNFIPPEYQTHGDSGNQSNNVYTNVGAIGSQQSRLEQTQIVGEMNIIETEIEEGAGGKEKKNKEEEVPPLPIRFGRGRRHRYEETIILFRPIIVRDVIVSQILPHLQVFLNSSDISAIKGENNQHKAVEVLLDKLSTSQEPGKWKMFVQALEECKYQAIVDTLKRKSVPDNSTWRNVLNIFSPQLREMIVPSEITAELLKTDVINSDDRSEIHQKERSAGAVAAADLLLDRIPRKHPDWFENFLSALRRISQHDLVDMLKLQTDTSPGTEGSDIQNGTTNSEDEISESNNDLTTEATKCKSRLKYATQISDTEQQTTNEPTKYDDVTTESKLPEYSETYEDADGYEEIEKPVSLDEADRTVQIGKRKIKYTRVVIDGKVCMVPDENEKEDICQFENVQSLREKKYALVTERTKLDLELTEYEDILKVHEKNNEMLSKKRSFCEQIKIKEKEAAALKAAISGEDIEEDSFRYQSATNLEDMVQHIAPGRRAITLNFRDPYVTPTVIPSRIPIDTGITMPVKLYDVEQMYKDSAFYSEC